jgi:predicted HTH transcriptional regulator
MRLVRGGEDTFLELKVKLSNPEKIGQGIVALANTGGGLIVFGVNDNLRVEGLDDAEEVREELVRICREDILPPIFPYIDLVSFDNGRRIVALDVEGKRRPYRTRDGRFYLRVGAEKREATREELSVLMDDARPVRFENIPVVAAGVADIDEAHLWSFVREFEGDAYIQPNSANAYPTGEVLERDLLLATPARDGDFIPTVAGLLLFGRDERVAALLPRSSINAVRFAGDNTQAPKVESLQLNGNLHTLYEAALRFIRRYCDLEDARPRTLPGRNVEDAGEADAQFAARAFYQRGAVGEALANALVHRDLALRDQTTRIFIFDRSIEILNPRRTNGFAPPAQKAIRYGVPERLNPQLAALFASHAYGLSLPTGGLPMLLRESRLFSTRRTEIHAFNDEFRLRLYGV